MWNNRGTALAIPLLIITIGIGWLLTSLGFAPAVNWVWTVALAAVGILTLVLTGFDKVSIVIGPFFLIASLMSVLRQTGRLELNVEVPVLVILIGALLLVAQLPNVPVPKWFTPLPTPEEEKPAAKKLRL